MFNKIYAGLKKFIKENWLFLLILIIFFVVNFVRLPYEVEMPGGTIDLGKAVVASKDDEIKKAGKSLAMRLIAAVIIWFVPMLVDAVFSLVDRDADQVSDYKVCQKCVTNPGSDTCKNSVAAQNS